MSTPFGHPFLYRKHHCHSPFRRGRGRCLSRCQRRFAWKQTYFGRTEESDSSVKLVLDVPGVKHQDIKVKFDNSTLQISGTRKVPGQDDVPFKKNYRIDMSSVDVSLLKANLGDGVLVVTFPKWADKSGQTIKVTRRQEAANVEETETENKNKSAKLTVDVPGVKLEDLQLTIEGRVLQVIGERKFGSSQSTILRCFEIDPMTADALNTSATLADGVLQVTIPTKAKEAPRDIEVIEGLPVEKNERKAEEPSEQEIEVNTERLVVETVEEEEETTPEETVGEEETHTGISSEEILTETELEEETPGEVEETKETDVQPEVNQAQIKEDKKSDDVKKQVAQPEEWEKLEW